MRIFILLAAMAVVSRTQTDCSRGACYPPSGDLLLGRAHQLHASSTCGLSGSEIYCTPYQQRRMKCCPCDSQNPKGELAHTVQDVLSTAAPDRWWQSRKEVNPVTLELDLQNLFQLENMVLDFKGPRPNALVIERTMDQGNTWQPALYLATDCQRAFPGVSTTPPRTLDETYCATLPPTGTNPYQDFTIHFSPFHQYASVPAPKSQKIEDVSGLTGLRLRLTQLGDVPRLPGRSLSRFYALKDMRVLGSCMCHGHANRCLPQTSEQPDNTQVSPQCDCQHNTAGVNCERCAELYNDRPWAPAEEGDTHACKRCECNNHAQRCHFDPVLYEASGRRSGGVCEACMHHTTGPKCDQCAPGYQPNPSSRMDQPDACIRCLCSSEGTVNGGRCDDVFGSCYCKAHVEGRRCDQCKRGYYGLNASNPDGCTKCSCSVDGSFSDVCDPVTGQCSCRLRFHGLSCEKCAEGYWKSNKSKRCEPCGCDPTNSRSDTCDQKTGQCQCRPGFGGRTCTECPENTYGDPLFGCQPCRCDPDGTSETCDKLTGACSCRLGVTGARCDTCSRGHCDSFPACELCPSCFFTLDAQQQTLSSDLQKLRLRLASRPGGPGDVGNLGPRIQKLVDRLKLIRDSLPLPPSSTKQINDALSHLDRLRDQLEDIELSPLDKRPSLNPELDKLQTLLDKLSLEYNAKNDTLKNTVSGNHTGALSAITKAYDESTDAAKKVDSSDKVVVQSAELRKDTLDKQNQVQPANTRDLNKLNQNLASRPDLTPVAKQVCGSVGSEPCTPLHCAGGKLCSPDKVQPCVQGEKCVGALPLSNSANTDAQEVKDRLHRVMDKIRDAAEKLQKTQDTTNEVRNQTDMLSDKTKQAREELEDDLKKARDAVKKLKDFLADPTSNLTHVKDVSDWILKAKDSFNPDPLRKKQLKLDKLAASLPDSRAVLKAAEPQLDMAKKLLQKAKDTRDMSLAIKDRVDKLPHELLSLEKMLSDLEDNLQGSLNITENLNETLVKTKDQLEPAEKALEDLTKVLSPMTPQLDKLNDLLPKLDQKAKDAQDTAGKAEDEATAATKDLLPLEKQLERLKAVAGSTGHGDSPDALGKRLVQLQKDAGVLANSTADMMNTLEGKAGSLKSLQDEIIQKSSKLEGLQDRLQVIVGQLRQKVHEFRTCQA